MKLFFLLIQVDRRYNFVYPEFTSILRKSIGSTVGTGGLVTDMGPPKVVGN